MYEIIFSVFSNDYIIRELCIFSTAKPLFIGTYDECVLKLLKIKGI